MLSDEHESSLESLLERTLDGLPFPVAIYTAAKWVIASRIIYVNRAYTELSGYSAEAIVGHSSLLLGGAQPDAEVMGSILPPDGFDRVTKTVTKERTDGSVYQVRVVVSPLSDARGEVTHFIAFEQPPSAPPSVATEALGHIRDDAFCQLAAGVVYEIEAEVSACRATLHSALESLRSRGAEGSPVVEALTDALAAAEHVAQTVTGLKAFTTESRYANEPMNVHDAIELAIRLAGPEVREKATVERRYAPVALVHASLPRLTRVFRELLRNAAEAIPGSMPHANHIVVETGMAPNGAVSITVSDTGVGIPAEDLPFVLDPFFTTKGAARTCGLGLSLARAELSKLGGQLTLESSLGRGSRAEVTIPAPARAALRAPRLASSARPRTRILSVADGYAEALFVGRPLADGDIGIVFSTWDAALERLALAERFDLVVCDGRSPRVAQFRASLHELAPDIHPFELKVCACEASSGEYLENTARGTAAE